MPDTAPPPKALVEALGASAAEQLLAKFAAYSNLPNAIAGIAKRPSDPSLEQAALRWFDEDFAETAAQMDIRETWALIALAARADVSVLGRVPADTVSNQAQKIASIRRAAAKHAKLLAAADAAPAPVPVDAAAGVPQLPAKVSEVAKWIAAHPDVDAKMFAPHPGQRAAARRSALRALGSIASPEAFDVLGQYATAEYSDADLAELHRAWGRFDRRGFAATMFGPAARGLRLDVCADLEGIGAVDGLLALDVILAKPADLSPLAECRGLERLRVHALEDAGLASIDAIAGLPRLAHLELIGSTRGADLTVLTRTPIEQLYLALDGADGSFLREMTRLAGLKLSGGNEAHAGLAGTALDLARNGVTVVLYRHERWVPELVANAPGDVLVEEANGFVRLRPAQNAG